MQILLATFVVIVILVASRGLYVVALALLFGAREPAVVRTLASARIARAAAADLDREYEELLRRYR